MTVSPKTPGISQTFKTKRGRDAWIKRNAPTGLTVDGFRLDPVDVEGGGFAAIWVDTNMPTAIARHLSFLL